MKILKQCFCRECGLDLGIVFAQTKYCADCGLIRANLLQEQYRREQYKSKFHREKVIGGILKNPKKLPEGLKEGMPCPGIGNGYCGMMIRRERVVSQKGYTTNFFDYVCGTHRFPDPREEK